MKIGTFTEYKGYIGSIEFSVEDNQHHGSVQNISDLVNYGADTIEELFEQYHNAVDSYIDLRKKIYKENNLLLEEIKELSNKYKILSENFGLGEDEEECYLDCDAAIEEGESQAYYSVHRVLEELVEKYKKNT